MQRIKTSNFIQTDKVKKIVLVLCFVLSGLLLTSSMSLAQPLPLNVWYAVVYQPETDTLHWIDATGEKASIPRPQLPDESQYLDLRVSPNGRTMVMASQLSSGLQGLGIYDFAAQSFIQVHQAQPGETISIGGENIFSSDSLYFAVGLYSGDFSDPKWRVLLFETQTGNATAFIDHTHPDAPEVQLSAPEVQYLDAVFVHFQLVPQSVGASHTWPAYAWQSLVFDPTNPTIIESPYTRANIQIQPLIGKAVMAYTDENFASAPQNGQTPNFNAIGAGMIGNAGTLTTIHADTSRYHLDARWAKGGEWILFLSEDTQTNRYWNIILAEGTPGNNSHTPFDPQFTDVYGTSDGYLLLNDSKSLFYSNGFMPNTAPIIAQLSPNAEVVYVTPIGVNFTLEQLPGDAVVAANPTPNNIVTSVSPPANDNVETTGDCSTMPSQRVSIGSGARVVPSMENLNVRQTPYGAIVLTLAGGDSFSVIGGPICEGDLYWWQIDYNGTIGWVAEATDNGYFIEPYSGEPQPPAQDPPPDEEPITDTPEPQQPPVGSDEEAAPEAEGNAPGCGRAPSNILSVGGTARVLRDLTPRNGPAGESFPYIFPEGTTVTIVGGPECAEGQRWWLVTGTAIPLAGGNPSSANFWVPDGIRAGRSLRP
jgi:hypothetical protein